MPVGLIINYNITSQPDLVYVNLRFANIWKARIAYTKASDFSLGIEVTYMIMPLPKVEKAHSVFFVSLANRFYF